MAGARELLDMEDDAEMRQLAREDTNPRSESILRDELHSIAS